MNFEVIATEPFGHVADLKAQLAQLREDNGYLKKMIDIMAAR